MNLSSEKPVSSLLGRPLDQQDIDIHQSKLAKNSGDFSRPVSAMLSLDAKGPAISKRKPGLFTPELSEESGSAGDLHHTLYCYNKAKTCDQRLASFETLKKIMVQLENQTVHSPETQIKLCKIYNWIARVHRHGCYDHQGRVVIEANTKTSLEFLKKSASLNDPSGYANYILGKYYLAIGNVNDALQNFTVASYKGNEGAAYHVSKLTDSTTLGTTKHHCYFLGKEHYYAKRYTQALSCFEQYIKNRGSNKDGRLVRASTFSALTLEALVKAQQLDKTKTSLLERLKQKIHTFFTTYTSESDAGGSMHHLRAFVQELQNGQKDKIAKDLKMAALLGNEPAARKLHAAATYVHKKDAIWNQNPYPQGCRVFTPEASLQKSPKLARFTTAQTNGTCGDTYENALSQIKKGQKSTHWIWYIFPQMSRLYPNISPNSQTFGVEGLDEARSYLRNPVLSQRLYVITEAVLNSAKGKKGVAMKINPYGALRSIMGSDIDAKKFLSCMSLFAVAHFYNMLEDGADTSKNALNSVFSTALAKFQGGEISYNTILKIVDDKEPFNKEGTISIQLVKETGLKDTQSSSIKTLEALTPSVLAKLKKTLQGY